MADKGFANRLEIACDGHPDIPAYGKGRQTWVKEKMKVSHEAVRKWFAGESRPRPAKMSELATLLLVDEPWLSLGITPEMAPKQRKAQNARAGGAVNVFMGLLQLSGGHCAFPAEDDASAEAVSFHAIREGTQTSYLVALAQPIEEGGLRIILPKSYERCAVVGAIQTSPVDVDFIRMPHDLIDKYADRKGGYVVIDLVDHGGSGGYGTKEDRWPDIEKFN
ncbi:hypothetical protein NAV33_07330 [Pseudomonas stutzeri]|uniref:hypothetical protein n=1 Tax=Stutzerimonas stutzeri TaxID=316 RepID=UPI00210956E1|nr:hypothetical protein [Stutzerimonas stutzeri]MCQ4311706.1 hypothetical protein [Stutzerimonas stutzeri]